MSPGDRHPFYVACVRSCTTACASYSPDIALRIFGWTCEADCKYHCGMRLTAVRRDEGLSILQFHGKWPFLRALGMQEPAAVLFSLCNFAVHAAGLRDTWREADWAWRLFGLVSLNAWWWAAVFHCRDVYWTQCADYFSATLLIMTATLVAAHHLLPARVMVPIALLAVAAFVEHVRRMLLFFDYGAHLKLNIGLGVLHLLLWVLWWLRERRARPHAWRAPAINALLALPLLFELSDSPPLWDCLDGHALWHAGTIPAAALYWRAFVAAELAWRRV